MIRNYLLGLAGVETGLRPVSHCVLMIYWQCCQQRWTLRWLVNNEWEEWFEQLPQYLSEGIVSDLRSFF